MTRISQADSPLAALSAAEQQALADIARHRVHNSISRRAALGISGAVGVAALAGRNAAAADTTTGENEIFASDYGSDGAAIQSAINESGAAEWLTVIIDPLDRGVYTVTPDQAPITLPSRTTLVVREGVRLADGAGQVNVFQNRHLTDDTSDDVHIHVRGEGGYIDGNKAGQTLASGDKGTGLGVGAFQNCISLIGVQHCSVENVTLRQPQMHGISFMGAEGVTVRGCTFEGDHFAGVHSHYRMTDGRLNKWIRIRDNDVFGGGHNAGQSAGIYAVGTIDLIVSGNTIDTRDNGGILVGQRAGQVNPRLTVTENILVDCLASAAYEPKGKNASLRIETKDAAIKQFTVTDNHVNSLGAPDNNQVGIVVVAPHVARSVTISQNTARSQYHGMVIQGGAGRVLRGFNVTENNCRSRVNPDGDGLRIVDASHGRIAGNIFVGNQNAGLVLTGENSDTAHVRVESNICNKNGQADAAPDPYGIHLEDCQHASLFLNTASEERGLDKTQTHGIYATKDCWYPLVMMNELRKNETAGMDLSRARGPATNPVTQDTEENWNYII